MLVALFIFVWITWRRKTAQKLLLPLSVTAAVVFALQLPWSDLIWRVAPELKFLQFPWRWTLVLGIPLALSIGAAVITRSTPSPTEPQFRVHAIAILIASIAAVLLGSWLFWQPCDEEDVVSAQVSVFQAGSGFEGTDEYTPIGADNSLIQKGLPQIRALNAPDAETPPSPATEDQYNPTYTPSPQDQVAADIKINQWLPEHKTLTVAPQTSGFAILRLMDYPAWQVSANGISVATRPNRDDGLMTIPVPAATTHIEIKYAATPDVWWGRALSAASLLSLLTLALANQKRRQVVLS
jgi:hypothetical protein